MKPTTRSLLHAGSFLVALVLLAAIAFPLDSHGVTPYGHKLIREIGIAITLAVSLNLILGIAGQFSLGHAAFAAAGANVVAFPGSLVVSFWPKTAEWEMDQPRTKARARTSSEWPKKTAAGRITSPNIATCVQSR